MPAIADWIPLADITLITVFPVKHICLSVGMTVQDIIKDDGKEQERFEAANPLPQSFLEGQHGDFATFISGDSCFTTEVHIFFTSMYAHLEIAATCPCRQHPADERQVVFLWSKVPEALSWLPKQSHG